MNVRPQHRHRRSPAPPAPSWRDEAACAGTFLSADTEMVRAKSGAMTVHTKTDALLALCQVCPVREACLLEALRSYDEDPQSVFGVWGSINFGDASKRSSPEGWPVTPNDVERLRGWALKRLEERGN